MEAFPCKTEKANEVVKGLLKGVNPRFGLPHAIQNGIGPAFASKITIGVARALAIKWSYMLPGEYTVIQKV